MTDHTSSLPDATRIGRVALTVPNISEAVAFYRDVIGLSVHAEDEGAARLGDGETELLVLEEDPDADPRGPTEAGLFHLAVRVPSRAALGATLDRIRDRWTLDGASDHRVSEALYLSDPAGNGVEVYCDRPRAEWPVADDGTVQMDTLPLDLGALSAASDGSASLPRGTDVGHVHLEPSSLTDARSFYVGALGFAVRQEWGESALFVAAGGYHHHVGLNTWNGRTDPARGRGLAWFEVVVPTDAALDAAADRLAGHGVTRRDGEVTATDADGIELRLRVEE